jgi:hypothetical protein
MDVPEVWLLAGGDARQWLHSCVGDAACVAVGITVGGAVVDVLLGPCSAF